MKTPTSQEWTEANRRYLEAEADIIALPVEKQLPRALARLCFLEHVRAEQDRRLKRKRRWYDVWVELAITTALAFLGAWLATSYRDRGFSVYLVLMSSLAAGRIRRWYV